MNQRTEMIYAQRRIKCLKLSRLAGFDGDIDNSFDEKYKKLHCDIAPLSHDSKDYHMAEKYLLTTQAPIHTESSGLDS